MEKPVRLYKFMRFRADPDVSAPHRNVNALLQRSEIRVSHASEFNDPYDCAPILKPLEGDALIRRVDRQMRKPQYQGLPKPARAQIHREFRNTVGSLQFAEDAHRMTVEQWGIYSLSASYRSVLMWGHYAESHRGICVEFEVDTDPFAKAERVIYSGTRVVADAADVEGDQAAQQRFMHASLLYKACVWSYEEEYRLLMQNVHNFFRFDPPLLTGIILGAKMRPEDASCVRKMAAARSPAPQIYQAALDPMDFRINRAPH